MDRIVPAEPFSPGEYLRDELDARNWTQEDLAQVLGITRRQVANLLAGKSAITPEVAVGIGHAFDQEPKTWMDLQINYELALAARKDREVAKRAALFNKAPVREMKKRCWLPDTDDISELETSVCKLFRIEKLADKPQFLVAAKKSTSYAYENSAQVAWYARALQMAERAPAAAYDPSSLESGIAEILRLSRNPEDARLIPKTLGDIGIRLVLLQHLPKSKIDAAALWLDQNTPAIALSLRFDRMDNLWFCLLHELVHIKYRHATHIDTLEDDAGELSGEPEEERIANAEAAAYLVSPAKLDSFIKRVRPLYYQERIVQFAHSQGVHPAIVVGQLHKRGELKPFQLRKLLLPIREHIVGQAITDGWGNDLWLE